MNAATERIRAYFRMVRATRLPEHVFSKQTCCAACRRKYNRAKMREYRNPKQQKLAFMRPP